MRVRSGSASERPAVSEITKTGVESDVSKATAARFARQILEPVEDVTDRIPAEDVTDIVLLLSY